MDLFSLASIALAFFVVAVSPGPANISNATLAMSRGRRASLIYGAGLSTGLVFWGVIAASGLGVVLQQSLYLMMVLKVLGGLYLIWLAFLAGRAALGPRADLPTINPDSTSYWDLFIKGIVLNVSNPKTVIAWMAALSIGLDAHANTLALVFGVGVCIVVGFAVNAMYSIVFSFKGVMTGYRHAKRWIDGVVSGLFALAGAGLIRSAFSR
jgi:threonine efflux protein